MNTYTIRGGSPDLSTQVKMTTATVFGGGVGLAAGLSFSRDWWWMYAIIGSVVGYWYAKIKLGE
jgi:hypothetical protein